MVPNDIIKEYFYLLLEGFRPKVQELLNFE